VNRYFSFVSPLSGVSSGTAPDLSRLNSAPAGENGYIITKNGHFAEEKTGNRVRFFGVNFTFAACFPSHEDADAIAQRLSSLGVNMVRIHHQDFNWGKLWQTGDNSHTKINPEALDRLDYLIFRLKQSGIYIDMCTHVSRQFTTANGFPESVEHLPAGYDKRIDYLDPKMIALQKDYAKEFYLHVNPYTRMNYAVDPCIALIEVNNEDTLVGSLWEDPLSYFNQLPEPFKEETRQAWVKWLKKRYGSDESLQKSWAPSKSERISLLEPLAVPSMADATGKAKLSAISGGVSIVNPDAMSPDWRIQLNYTGIDLRPGESYVVKFQAKSDAARSIPMLATLDQTDWHGIGLNVRAELGSDWRDFSFIFEAKDPVPKHGRLSFSLGGSTGEFSIKNLTIRPVSLSDLMGGQSLSQGSIGVPKALSGKMGSDWVQFLVDTELTYASDMRRFFKSELKTRANLTISQMEFGGVSSFLREAGSDYADAHSYWQQPDFPHVAWDPIDWTIPNSSLVQAMADGKRTPLDELAESRVAGKPYSISEFNEPAPNNYRAEAFPVITSFAASQDWDCVLAYDFGEYGTGAKNDAIQGFFAVNSDPARSALLPWCALVFRQREIGRSEPLFAELNLYPNEIVSSVGVESYWKALLPSGGDVLNRFMQANLMPPAYRNTSKGIVKTQDAADFASSLKVVKAVRGGVYIAQSSMAMAVAGFIGGSEISAGDVHVKAAEVGDSFGVVTIATLDQNRISGSKRLLLSAVGDAQNSGEEWNNQRTSVGNRWGIGPVQAEGITADISIATSEPLIVWALASDGHRDHIIPSFQRDGALHFSISPNDRAIWYELSSIKMETKPKNH
jgi:hypothetical protein